MQGPGPLAVRAVQAIFTMIRKLATGAGALFIDAAADRIPYFAHQRHATR